MFGEELELVNGNDIRMMRECSGKSVLEIAESMGMDSTDEYDKWENDKGLPDMNEFIHLSTVCGLDPVLLVSALSNKKGDLALDDFLKLRTQVA